MAKALKPLIIILLVLSITALVLGIMLFNQKKMLKTRIVKHQDAVIKVANNLHMEGLDPELMKKAETMDKPLNDVAIFAMKQYDDLQYTKQDLEATSNKLVATTIELDTTKTELEGKKQEVVALTEKVDAVNAELAQCNGTVTQLEQDKAGLQTQIEECYNKIVTAEEDRRECQDEKATLDKIIKDMEAELGGDKIRGIPPGLSGKILVVNPDWNFVVLDIGSDSGLVQNAEMLVHRGEKLVGKVRISSVQKNLSVAEIINDWVKAPIQEGDCVLF